MPIFRFHCPKCDKNFETLLKKHDDPAACPDCGSAKVEKLLSTFAAVTSHARPACGKSECPSAHTCGSGCGCHH